PGAARGAGADRPGAGVLPRLPRRGNGQLSAEPSLHLPGDEPPWDGRTPLLPGRDGRAVPQHAADGVVGDGHGAALSAVADLHDGRADGGEFYGVSVFCVSVAVCGLLDGGRSAPGVLNAVI